MLHSVAMLLIICELLLTTVPSSLYVVGAGSATSTVLSLKHPEIDVNSRTHINQASLVNEKLNRLPRHTVQGLQRVQNQRELEDQSSLANSKTKRSFSTGGGWASTTFNGLAGQHSIRSSSSSSNNDYVEQQYTEAKPIYEEQQDNDYEGGSGGSGGSGSSYGLHSSAVVANAPALQSAIYNLQTAGTHNGAMGTSGKDGGAANAGGNDGFLPSWNFGKLSTSFIASQTAPTPYGSGSGGHGFTTTHSNSNHKISEGNFLHHYGSASAFNEYTPQSEYQPYQQQQLQQQQNLQLQLQQHEKFYNTVEHNEATADESEHDGNNYPPSAAAGHFANYSQQEFEQQQEKQPDVINYVPYPVVKKQHVPVREPVQVPVSHAVIIPVSKPVPIHIPVTQNVQVPVHQDLKIPVERVVPYPVEKHVPVPVEKRVPYPVVKYVPIKIPRPFPVKVPVFKTVLHKVKGWW